MKVWLFRCDTTNPIMHVADGEDNSGAMHHGTCSLLNWRAKRCNEEQNKNFLTPDFPINGLSHVCPSAAVHLRGSGPFLT